MKKNDIVIGASVAGVILLIGIVFTIGADRKADMQEAQTLKEMEIEREYKECKGFADFRYNFLWEDNCSGLGLGKDCRLPGYLADDLARLKENDLDRCFDEYRIKVNNI